ncbi:MAG TPA: hypothetical protein PKW28_11740 [Turneriella sp.]|nr:hypothetical protein [Turneriella sp.]
MFRFVLFNLLFLGSAGVVTAQIIDGSANKTGSKKPPTETKAAKPQVKKPEATKQPGK